MRKVILFSLLAFFPIISYAQTVIRGVVSDSDSGLPIEGVIVQCINNNKVVSYNISNNNGAYELKINLSTPQIIITYEHISYEKLLRAVDNKSHNRDIQLKSKAMQLKEVTVYAPRLTLRGDTLSYRLSAFKGLADITLEDAMKNLPGVTIKESGIIQYLGKDISNFYIEDLNLLGGRYGIATKNIKADMVASVELIENHQPIKMLENRSISNDVAVNIKLEAKAKLKPSGTIEGGLGYGEEGILYRLGVTGMVFSPKFQTISTAKFGNVGARGSDEIASLIGGGQRSRNTALSVLGNASTSTPPLKESRYSSIMDGAASINTINKLGSGAVFKVNAHYSYNKSNYDYSTVSSYYIGEKQDIVTESMSPLSINHRPAVALEYNLNNKSKYIYNRFRTSASVRSNEYPVVNNNNNISQTRESITYNISNDFSYRKLLGDNMWSVNSQITYITTPDNSILFNSSQEEGDNRLQNSEGRTFFMDNKFDFSFKIGDYWTVFTPISLDLSYDKVNTELIGNKDFINNLEGVNLSPSFSPRFEYVSPNNRLKAIISAPMSYTMLNYNGSEFSYNKFVGNPRFEANYTISPSSKLNLKVGAGNSIGDITNFLINPIQISYREVSIKSGILAESFRANTTLGYEFKLPFSYLFFNAEAGYNYQKRNLMNSQIIDGQDIINTAILNDNQSQGVTSGISIAKLFQPIGTKFNIGGGYSWSVGDMMQQNAITQYTQQSYNFEGGVVSRPWKWIELNYSVAIGWNDSKFKDVSKSLMFESHSAKLSVFPTPKLNIFFRVDYIRNEIVPTKYVNMALMDAGITYKFKRIQLELSLNNILNTQKYEYTIFNGLDSFSYNYRLRGREIMLSFKLL